VTPEQPRCDLSAQSESHPNYEAVIRALINGPALAGDIEAGARFIVNALRGFGMRHHFECRHPDRVEEGIATAAPEEPDREAWLYGYRFTERAGK
jgi:hypothetical protein